MVSIFTARVIRFDLEDTHDQWRLHFYRLGANKWQVECSIRQFVGTGGWSEKFIGQYEMFEACTRWRHISRAIATQLATFLQETGKPEHAAAAARILSDDRHYDIECGICLITGINSSAGMAS